MAHKVPGLPGVVQLDDADLTDEQRALIEAAETGTIEFDHSTILRGQDAEASGQALVQAALGGEENLRRALGGRPPLDPAAVPGEHSPVRQVRLPAQMNARLNQVAVARGQRPSDIIREALDQYLADAG